MMYPGTTHGNRRPGRRLQRNLLIATLFCTLVFVFFMVQFDWYEPETRYSEDEGKEVMSDYSQQVLDVYTWFIRISGAAALVFLGFTIMYSWMLRKTAELDSSLRG